MDEFVSHFCRRQFIAQRLADYIIRRDAYFKQCGGFELLRVRYYFDADDRYSVMLDIEGDAPPAAILKERKKMKIRFRDVLSTRHDNIALKCGMNIDQ